MAKPRRKTRERESSSYAFDMKVPPREGFEMVEAIALMAEGMIARDLKDGGRALSTAAHVALDRLEIVRRLWGKMT